MFDGNRHTPLDPINDPDLQSIDALLTTAGKPWRQRHMPDESAQQFLASLAAQESAAGSDGSTPARISMPIVSHRAGDRFMVRPSRITALLAVALTLCLIAASAGIFAVLNHHHTSTPATNKISPSPTSRGPLTMPGNIMELAMVSDHEGWAIQGPDSSYHLHLLHFHNGTWQAVSLSDLPSLDIRPLVMESASNGWLIDSTQANSQTLYHYNGTTWGQVPLPAFHGTGMPQLSTFSLGANGDDWLTGEYINTGSQMQSGLRIPPYGALSCLPNCGKPLLLHYVGGRWVEVTVPAGISITPESVSMGWFAGGTADPHALYRYQNGSWSRVPLGISDSLEIVSMVSSTNGWIEAIGSQPATETVPNTWVIYHFDGTAVQRVAGMTSQHCFGQSVRSISAFPPADAWVAYSSDSDCLSMPQLLHIQGETPTTVPFPAPYNYVYGNIQRDADGNVWVLTSQAPTPPALMQEAILRWSGNQWVIFAQTQPAGG